MKETMSNNSSSEAWGTLTDSETNIPIPLKDKTIFAGRSKDCQVRIVSKNAMVSATHFSLERNESVMLQDLSKNGTLVVNKANEAPEDVSASNTTKLKKGERASLVDGCVIAIPSGRNSNNYKLSFTFHLLEKASSSSAQVKEVMTSEEDCKAEQNSVSEEIPAKRQKLDEEPQPSTSAAVKPPEETKEGKANLSSNIGEKLLCTICYEILYKTVSLQPCLHNFCGGCACEWLRSSNECPNCRKKVTAAARNHFVVGLVNDYLEAHPEAKRDADDVKAQDEKNVVENEVLTLAKIRKPGKKKNKRNRGRRNTSSSSSSLSGFGNVLSSVLFSWTSLDSSGDDDDDVFPMGVCRQCPNNNNAGLHVPDSFTCQPRTNHITCNCCFTRMPERGSQDGVPPQKCCCCGKIYCHLYWGHCGSGACLNGCLRPLKEHTFDNNIYHNLILNNLFESNILKNVLDDRNETYADILQQGCAMLDNGEFRLDPSTWPPGIYTPRIDNDPSLWNSDSAFCKGCATSALKDFAYAYRKKVDREDLPEAARGRPDCYWGKNCRTQRNRPEHARKLNHICEQTKFD